MRNPNYNLSRPTHKGGKRGSFQGPSRYCWPHGGQQYDPNHNQILLLDQNTYHYLLERHILLIVA